MEIGNLWKEISHDEAMAAVLVNLEPNEVVLYACGGRAVVSKVIFVITEKRILRIDPKKQSKSKVLLRTDVQRINFSKDSLIIDSGFKGFQLSDVPSTDIEKISEIFNNLGVNSTNKAKDKEQKKLDFQSQYGDEVASGTVGWTPVFIYSKGYVLVREWGVTEPEKLISITANMNVLKKTGPGRAVGGLLSVVPNSLGIPTSSPNRRGDVYLAITTEKKTHMLHVQVHQQHDAEKVVLTLESAGKAVIEASTGNSSDVSVPTNSISAELSKLAELLSQGIITQEEFNQAKAKALGS